MFRSYIDVSREIPETAILLSLIKHEEKKTVIIESRVPLHEIKKATGLHHNEEEQMHSRSNNITFIYSAIFLTSQDKQIIQLKYFTTDKNSREKITEELHLNSAITESWGISIEKGLILINSINADKDFLLSEKLPTEDERLFPLGYNADIWVYELLKKINICLLLEEFIPISIVKTNQTINYNTSLLRAASQGDCEQIRLALCNCANIDAINDNGYTALMLSAKNNHLWATKVLVTLGANKAMKQKKGIISMFFNNKDVPMTALDMTSNDDIIKFLSSKTAIIKSAKTTP